MSVTANMGITLLDVAQSQKEVTINNALNSIDSQVLLKAGGTMTGALKITRTAVATGNPAADFWVVAPADTGLTASTEAPSITLDLSATRQFATGALTTQRAMRIVAPTYGFVGASTITTASTVSISGAPIAGTNATITNPWALNVETGSSLFGGGITVSFSDAGTTNEPILLNLQHRSSGTPAASFGSTINVTADNASNAVVTQLAINTGWSSATAGAESSLSSFFIKLAGVSTEVMRLNANGNGQLRAVKDFQHAGASLGFYNTTPVAQAAAYTLAGTVTRTFPADPSVAYTGIATGVGGTPYAQLTDLNTLRTTVSSLEGVVRQIVQDLGKTNGVGLNNT